MNNKENKRWFANMDKDAVVFAVVVFALAGLGLWGNIAGWQEFSEKKQAAKKVNVVDMITKRDTVDIQKKNVIDMMRVKQK